MLLMFNKIKPCAQTVHLCVRAPATSEDIGPCYRLLKVHLISFCVPFALLSSDDPWKLIGSAIIDDISIPLILLGRARGAAA